MANSTMNFIECIDPIIDECTKILILGTMPGGDSLEKKQYYNNPNNIFWDIIYRVFDTEWNMYDTVTEKNIPYESKIFFLKEHNLGLWDVIKSCYRIGNSDKDIIDPIYNDINELLLKYPNIQKVIFGSKKAYEHYKKGNDIIENLKFEILDSTSSQCPKNPFLILAKWRKALST